MYNNAEVSFTLIVDLEAYVTSALLKHADSRRLIAE
jgi:hypothetical protein